MCIDCRLVSPFLPYSSALGDWTQPGDMPPQHPAGRELDRQDHPVTVMDERALSQPNRRHGAEDAHLRVREQRWATRMSFGRRQGHGESIPCRGAVPTADGNGVLRQDPTL